MILADTSIWVEHLRHGTLGLSALLDHGEVVCHPFVVCELACGDIRNRAQVLALLRELPMVPVADDEDVVPFIERHDLMGQGLGLIDIHLLMSTLLSGARLWSIDKKLDEVAWRLGAGY